MAAGDITTVAADVYELEILSARTTTNGVPALSTDGIALQDFWARFGGLPPADLEVRVVSTAGSGTMDVTVGIHWFFGTAATDWALGDLLNGGSAIPEYGTNTIGWSEPFSPSMGASRVYAEVRAINGTNTAVTVYLRGRMTYGVR